MKKHREYRTIDTDRLAPFEGMTEEELQEWEEWEDNPASRWAIIISWIVMIAIGAGFWWAIVYFSTNRVV